VSQDAAYGLFLGPGGRKGRTGNKAGGPADGAAHVLHAEPAATLLTLPAKLDSEELARFHRCGGGVGHEVAWQVG
jgi:hypothetical protein